MKILPRDGAQIDTLPCMHNSRTTVIDSIWDEIQIQARQLGGESAFLSAVEPDLHMRLWVPGILCHEEVEEKEKKVILEVVVTAGYQVCCIVKYLGIFFFS